MSQKWKRLVRAVAFLLIFGLIFWRVQAIVVPNRDWPPDSVAMRKSTYGLMNEPKDSIDVLWVGTSHVYCGISPMEVYRDTHIRSYLVSQPSQRIVMGYRMLEQAMEAQSPTLVALDASTLTYTEESYKDKAKWQQNIDALPYRAMAARIGLAKEMADRNGEPFDDEYIGRSLLPLLQYHDNYRVTEAEFRDVHLEQIYHRKGFVPGMSTVMVDESIMDEVDNLLGAEAEEDLPEEESAVSKAIEGNRRYVEQMLALCRERGCELMLIKVPVHRLEDYRGYWSAEKHALVQKMADELGIDFLDLNYEDLGLDWQRDTRDGGDHLNLSGATKVSRFLGEWLRANRDFDNLDDEGLNAQWDVQLDLYDWEMQVYEWRMIDDLKAYCDNLKGSDYTLLVNTGNGVEKWWTDDYQTAFAELTGCPYDLRDAESQALGMVSRGGQAVQIERDAGGIEFRGFLPGDVAYTISRPRDGTAARIRVDHKRMCKSDDGFMMLVYDNELQIPVDGILMTEDENGELALHHFQSPFNQFRAKQMEHVYSVMAAL